MQASRRQGGRTSVQGRAWRALLEANRDLVRVLAEEMKQEAGLDLLYYDVMLHVSEGRSGRRMTELAESVVLSKSGLTSLVDRMERDGLLERRPDPNDRRATLIVLTKDGEARFRKAAALHKQVVRRIFTAHISEQEAALITDVMERLRQRLQDG